MTITAKELRDATARGEGPLAKAADDEPVFLLRAQDCLAADLVDVWAIQANLLVPTIGGSNAHHKISEAKMIGDAMRAWPVRRAPD